RADGGGQRPRRAGEQVVRRDEVARAGGGEEGLDLAGPEGFIHEHRDRADGQRGEKRGGGVAAAFQENRHGIIRRDARGEERGSDRRGALDERGVIYALLALDHRRTSRAALGSTPQEP